MKDTNEADKSDPDYSNIIFFDILEKIKTNDKGSVIDAALAVLSYYFESCDIFETV